MKFLLRIYSPILFILSIILLIYLSYKSQIVWDGNRNDFYLPFIIFLLMINLFSILIYFSNQKIKEYLIICSLSIFVSIYLFEGYLSFYKKNDHESKKEIYKKLIKINKNVSVSVAPLYVFFPNNSFLPLSNVSNSTMIDCKENGYFSTYKSDRYGFNNPDREWDEKEIEFLLVGDSYTQGACVNRPDDIGSVLRNLSGKSVLNLGHNGNGPLVYYAGLREFLNSNVKNVLWIFNNSNDLENLNDETNHKILSEYLKDLNFTQNLKAKQPEIDNLINDLIKKDYNNFSNIREFIFLSNLRRDTFKLRNQTTKINKNYELKSLSELTKIIQLSNNLVKENNSKLYFIYLPKGKNDKHFYLIKEVLDNLDISLIDIKKEMIKRKLDINYLNPPNKHFTPLGYYEITKIIYDFVKKDNSSY